MGALLLLMMVAGDLDLVARMDQLHATRDQATTRVELRRALDQGIAQRPNDVELLWRGSRFYFWESDEPSLDRTQRAQLARTGWDLAERAIAIQPNRVEGYFWAAANMGNYGLAAGAWRALREGVEGKFSDRLRRAERLNADYQAGSIQIAWGRFWDKMPWPRRDVRKAELYYRHVLQKFPKNVRAHVFYADLLIERERFEEARRLLDQVARAPVGGYDAPEERRMKGIASRLQGKLR